MTTVNRSTPAGRAYLDLQNQARRTGATTQQLLTFFALERWLARLSVSPYASHFILKGGVLLAALDARRPTVDADALARGIPMDHATIAAVVKKIATLSDPDGGDADGITFDTDSLTTRTIREEGLYAGVRVTFVARLATARIKVSLDVNIGDPVIPAPQQVLLPSVRPGTPPITILGYPLETVLAEKITTAIALGDANTRMKDYADVWTLTGRHAFDGRTVRAALVATADHRGVVLRPLSEAITDLARIRATAFAAYRASLAVDGKHLPASLGDLVPDVLRFVDPLVTVTQTAAVWNATSRTWT